MKLFETLDKDLEESFKRVVSIGWKLRKIIAYGSEKTKELEDEQYRLNNYHKSFNIIKETFYSHTTPSGKIYMNKIKNDLKIIEDKAVKNEKFELAHISQIYQQKIG
ncbi:hypothetical protein [Christiangramia sp. SM2212]|uniref:Uncharacterized protein n=1 Tax=Christiangramia sediminicola TaxID=3073267 RepID=A0ABU1EQY5_9FLAO|nr:hypothetical protein [Christiangramia sp. SM2212]MDR5590804.1 hypothetical protein [Christiangramia sp. SM2212]